MKKTVSLERDEKAAKQAIAALALFGLTEMLLYPPEPSVFAAAWRIIFTGSDELKKIAVLLEVEVETLQKNTIDYLTAMGFCGEKIKFH